ncbi:MAG: ApaG domain [Akkermansiaceae bacterium]|nr:ApaG domain [Akkermansiaceae bacterium]
MPTEPSRRLPELDTLRMRVALAGLQLVREPLPCYKVFYRINLLNNGVGSVRLLGRKWRLQDACGQVRIIEAAGVFNSEPVLPPGAVFSFSGGHCFEKPPVYLGLSLFGQARGGIPFMTPPLEIPLAAPAE